MRTALPRAALLLSPLFATAGLTACGDSDFERLSCDDVEGACSEFTADQVAALIDKTNSLSADTTLVLGKGIYSFSNQLTLRGAVGITLTGQGIDQTTLNFAAVAAQSNGVDVVGNNFTITDLTIADAKKDGLRIEDSENVVIRRVKATWSAGPAATNGAYGLYPVKSKNVLIENSEAFNAADAGIYVGQVQNAVVRNNLASGNVAGIEIENTQFADVYGNTAEDNTGGLLIFDLPGNPIAGRDIRVHGNTVRNNNRANFAPGGTVAEIPAGTGTFAMASRRVEIFDNTYSGNKTTDIALVSGLIIEDDLSRWSIPEASLVGNYDGISLIPDGQGGLMNFRTEQILVRDNRHSGSGTAPDPGPQLGQLLWAVYASAQTSVDTILYDSIGESAFDATDSAGNSNDNHICVSNNSGASFASIDIVNLQSHFDLDLTYRPASPFAPFDCTSLTGGPVPAVDLSALDE